ncbi:MAG: hypothetical protein R3248_04315 [Candidatus Promineifilaceae bacterium]|nr:hypothetical protein [Candidatus Promineifilaceae bacterium]
MNFSTKELVMMAVFGALWGAVEISLGSVLKALHLPFNGALLAAAGLAIALTGRLFVPRRGATLFIGVIATLLKLFSIGGVVLGPMVGILSEALLAELALSLFGKPSRVAFLLAGALGVCWTVIQPFVTGALLFGRDMLEVWLELVNQGRRLLGLGSGAAVWIAIVLVAMHALLGALSGWLAWEAGKQLNVRLSGDIVFQNH